LLFVTEKVWLAQDFSSTIELAGDAPLIQNAAPGSIVISTSININILGICLVILPSLCLPVMLRRSGPSPLSINRSTLNSKTA
jgi:hypothetical protein